ncbi:unnamed protein product [Symbiodinium sp. CCMP2456]|nr:unnamed protein product [Symbiodinium sp. CCMP2456]
MAVSPEPCPQTLGQVADLPDYEQEVPPDHDARIHIHEVGDDWASPDAVTVKAPSPPQASTPGDDWMVDMVASMEPTRPEIIRGVPVHCALRGCGQAMRGKQPGLYKFSCATADIDEFWSHSWHTSAWMKFVTAWYLNSGFIATAFGMVGAALGCVLHAVEVLPATVDNGFCKSQWSVLIGVTFYLLCFMFWRARKLVFLDFLCINQEDESLKGEAMLSMGAILKSSASMLVLWDPSWVQRFWCVFELASFLRSRPTEATTTISQHLSIRPNLMGPVLLIGKAGLIVLLVAWPNLLQAFANSDVILFGVIMGLTMSAGLLPCFLCLVYIGRRFCCSLDTLQQQLGKFQVNDAKCYCCTVNHVDDETGERIPCDRDIMLKCIGIWFGSTTDFEHLVRGHVRTTLLRELTSPLYLYRQIVMASSPVMWLFLDRVATLLVADDVSTGLCIVIDALAWWLMAIPSIVLLGAALAYKLRMRQPYWVTDFLLSLVVLLPAAAMLIAVVAIYMTFDWAFDYSLPFPVGRIMASVTFFIVSALLAVSALYLFWKAKDRAICT